MAEVINTPAKSTLASATTTTGTAAATMPTLTHLTIPGPSKPSPSTNKNGDPTISSTLAIGAHTSSSSNDDTNIGASHDPEYYATLPINVSPNVTPASPPELQPTIGLIGMGAMGRMYARYLGEAGWIKINVCDIPEKYEDLKKEYEDNPNIYPLCDGHAVSRSSDFIVYSVEAEFIDRVVKQYGPSTKVNAIVAGQTSVKAPEKEAFEKYIPKDVHIVSCHSLHGPSVSPLGQPLIIIRHRSSLPALQLVESILRPLRSRHVHLSYTAHDIITASTQAVTHAAFLSMGSAWSSARSYPWESGLYVGGIETAKVNLTLRIYANSWHVYAGLAILNPEGGRGIECYARCAGELFKMMLAGGGGTGEEGKRRFRERVEWARDTVFGKDCTNGRGKRRRPILLSEDVLDRFSLGKLPSPNSEGKGRGQGTFQAHYTGCTPGAGCCPPLSPVEGEAGGSAYPRTTEDGHLHPHASGSGASTPTTPTSPSNLQSPTHPPTKYRPNSHLSLLAMVDCWAQMGINPYEHLELAATPLFRLFLGVAEYLFLSDGEGGGAGCEENVDGKEGEKTKRKRMTPLSQAIHSALYDTWHRSDDLEFVVAARGWSQAISFGSFEVYKRRFEETRGWFEREGRFADGEVARVGNEMIKAVMESEIRREEEEGVVESAKRE